jgi:hypothetical protein
MGDRLSAQRARRKSVPVPEAKWPGQLPEPVSMKDVGTSEGSGGRPSRSPSLDEDGAERLAGRLGPQRKCRAGFVWEAGPA